MRSRRPRSSPRLRQRPRNVVHYSRLRMERRHRVMAFGKFFAAAALIVLTFWAAGRAVSRFLNGSEHFKIRAIEVEGNRNVSDNEILALLPFREGDNMLRVFLSDAESNIRQCKPELKNIRINRRYRKIVVKLEERTPVACVTADGQRLGLDDDNKPFPLRGKLFTAFLPEIVSENAEEREYVLKFLRHFEKDAKELAPQVTRYYAEPVDDVVLELKDGTRIYWGEADKDGIRPKLERLGQVMADARKRFAGIEYVNLCYFNDGRILLKPKDTVLTTQAAAGGNAPIDLTSAR